MISDMEAASEYPVAALAIANNLKVELQKCEEVEYLNIATAVDRRFKVLSLEFFTANTRYGLEMIQFLADVRFAEVEKAPYRDFT